MLFSMIGMAVDFDFVDKWVDKVLKHQVKDLTLGFSFEDFRLMSLSRRSW